MYNFVVFGIIPANEKDKNSLGLIRDNTKKILRDRARRAAIRAKLAALAEIIRAVNNDPFPLDAVRDAIEGVR